MAVTNQHNRQGLGENTRVSYVLWCPLHQELYFTIRRPCDFADISQYLALQQYSYISSTCVQSSIAHRMHSCTKLLSMPSSKASHMLMITQCHCSESNSTLHRIPARAQRFYRCLHEERHYSQMTLLVGLLAIPLTLGKTVELVLTAPHHSSKCPEKSKSTCILYVDLKLQCCGQDVQKSDSALLLPAGLVMICMMDAYMVRQPASYHGHQQ